MLNVKPMTETELAKCPDVSPVCKKAIESAIADWGEGDDMMDSYFRAEVVVTESPNEPEPEYDFNNEYVWFQAGWKDKGKE